MPISRVAQTMPSRALMFLLALVLALPMGSFAQQPPKLEPLPEAPPPPPGVSNDVSERPIRITPGANEQFEETIVDGKATIRVTRPDGTVYYLMQDQRDAGVARQQGDSGLRVPMWVIREF